MPVPGLWARGGCPVPGMLAAVKTPREFLHFPLTTYCRYPVLTQWCRGKSMGALPSGPPQHITRVRPRCLTHPSLSTGNVWRRSRLPLLLSVPPSLPAAHLQEGTDIGAQPSLAPHLSASAPGLQLLLSSPQGEPLGGPGLPSPTAFWRFLGFSTPSVR